MIGVGGLMKLKDTTANSAFDYVYLFKRLYKYIKPYLGRILINLVIAIPVGLLDAVIAYSLKPYMDNVIIGKNAFWAALLPLGIILFAIVQGALKYINNYLTEWTGQKVTNTLKIDLFKKLTSMNCSFFDINSTGHILTRFLSDADSASRGLLENLKTFLTTGIGAISLVFVLLYNSWQLAIVGIVVLGSSIVPATLVRKRIKRTSNATMKVGGGITTNFNETCMGNKIVSAYNLKEYQNKKFTDQIQESFYLVISLIKRTGLLSPMMYFVSSLGIAVVMWYGNHLIITGQLTPGALMSFVTSLILLYKPIKSLGDNLSSFQGTFVSLGRVFELFDITPEIKDKDNAIEVHEIQSNISFEHINFEYVKNLKVINDLSLEVKKGETIAIVGNSGGGKTTFVNLLPRFYDIQSGVIKIDGVDIKEFTIESLRSLISVVFQDNFLFSGTIKENILMGNFNATEEEIKSVIKSSHLDEFLDSLPEGVNTEIGERGTTLSGGQRQRVAIARAMIRNSPIVILDEATSALDNESEAIVQRALDNLMKNKTVFVIAHRLSTIKNADRIAVINNGSIVELGSHEELLNIEAGQYKHLYDMQFSKIEDVLV